MDFWENHFTVFAGKGQMRWYLTSYDRDVIRPNALGHFRDLLGAVAKSPAMLFYLDNAQSVADSTRSTRCACAAAHRRPRGLNENYARELMELHTLGVDGGYTQKDVVEVARALTGWRLPPGARHAGAGPRAVGSRTACRAGEFLVPRRRCTTPESKGRPRPCPEKRTRHRGWRGGARHPRAPSVDGEVHRAEARGPLRERPAAAGARRRAAATFLRTRRRHPRGRADDRHVARVLRRGRIPRQSEVAVRGGCECDARARMPADPTPRTAQLVARLGQPIFGHQAPNGWPETRNAWMNTGAILNRINFGMAAAANRVPGASLRSVAGRRWTARRVPGRAGRRSDRVAPGRARVARDTRDPHDRRSSDGRQGAADSSASMIAGADSGSDPAMSGNESAGTATPAHRGAGFRKHSRAHRPRAGRRPRVRLARVPATIARRAAPRVLPHRPYHATTSLREIRRSGPRDDGPEPALPAPHGVRHGVARRGEGQDADLPVPARRGRRAERRRAPRRDFLLLASAAYRDSAAERTAGGAARRPSISTGSSDCIRRCSRSSRSGTAACSRRFTRWGARARPARTSTPRITWSPARRT